MSNEKNNKNNTSVPVADLEPDTCHASDGQDEVEKITSPCRIHIVSRRKRLTDADGVSGKAVIDGIVAAGVLPDDSAQYVKEVSYSQQKSEVEETEIIIEYEV